MTQEEFFKRYTYTPSRDRIGGGGFGTVYKAYNNLLHRQVAIKVSEVKTTADGKKTFSLKDEFEALAHVPKHPNIANYEELYSYEDHRGLCDYAVMQYYPDGNLSNAIKQGLTVEQKEDIATQLLEGIDFLHKHKVVHRDLKPGNILIVKHGGKVIPLITDFGLSKAAGVVDGSVFSNSFGAGTPRYSSPEQLQGNPLRFNTDLWSYGAILYELFTGTQLFTAGSGAANTAQADMEIYNKIVNGNVQSLGKMPETWRKVAERCLVVDPTKRAKDAAELFAIIRGEDDETEITEGSSSVSRVSTPSSKEASGLTPPFKGGGGIKKDTPTPTDKPTNKKALWIGLGIAAAAIVALLLLLKPKSAPTPTDPDTQAYEACQTVADYRAYISDYGRNSLHYSEAKAFVDQYLSDSSAKVQRALAEAQAQQQAEADAKAQAEAEKKEEAAYKKCTTIAACDSYLKAYPKGKYVDEVRGKKAELEAISKANAEKKGGNGSANGHDYVDLGLPSGTLWATCNVGANKPEDYGNYYAWGETETKSYYNWDNYKYVADGAPDQLTKYCNRYNYGNNGFTDNKTSLLTSDDPAAKWGSGWRTPSKVQWDELLKYTTSKWTIQNGVKGRLFTSKNGQTIFLPAAGNYYSKPYKEGEEGIYWSRSIGNNGLAPRHSWYLFFKADRCEVDGNDRCYGHTVRPVR